MSVLTKLFKVGLGDWLYSKYWVAIPVATGLILGFVSKNVILLGLWITRTILPVSSTWGFKCGVEEGVKSSKWMGMYSQT